MNSRFLIVIIYALTLSLIVQYFFFPKTNQTALSSNDIILQVKKDAVTIPSIPHVELLNHTSSGFTLNPCKDLSITIDSKPLTDLEKYPKFCEAKNITSGTSAVLPFSELYPVFANLPGKYVITIKTPLGDRTTFFEMETPSSIRALLSTVFYEPIYNLFVALITFIPGHALGWAIVIITFIIRLILLVPQHHMLTSQKKLQVIQPKIKELQAKYKDDQAKLGMEMLELYKKEGVNPMGSCLPLIIQMPILIGLYWVISGISDPSNFYHLYSFFTSFNPSSIDTKFFGLELHQVGGIMGGIFALVLAFIQWIQAKLSFAYNPPPVKKEESKGEEISPAEAMLDPNMMKNMMLYMFPIMIGVSAFFFPLGIGLYWFIGTLFVIGQQAYVNRKKK